ncbi:MAG: dienelactone hydrolase family protein [Acidiferrobacterales bacterium]
MTEDSSRRSGPDRSGRSKVAKTGPSSDFALAAKPVGGLSAIHTDATGVSAGEVSIAVHDGEIPGYSAMPEKDGKFPVIVVIQEIFGVHEHIRDVCRRFAKLGYLAVAPELYARQGNVSKIADIQQIIDTIVSKVSDEQVLSDIDATIAWVQASGKGDISRLGITGFCWGGRIVWLYAAHNPRLAAGVAWYGRLMGETSKRQPFFPLDVAGKLRAPVLGLYGGADQSIPLDTVEKMRARLEEAGGRSEIIVYPDAPHAFFADYRPNYRKDAALDGWKRTLAWLNQNGVA